MGQGVGTKIFGKPDYKESYTLDEYALLKEQLLAVHLKEVQVEGYESKEGQDLLTDKQWHKLQDQLEEKDEERVRQEQWQHS